MDTRLLLSGFGGSTHATSRWLFLRLLGVVYLFAFWSLATQIVGLVGHDGILPAAAELDRSVPTVFWLSASDAALKSVCWAGVALAVLLMAGVAPLVVLPLLWFGYLSLSVVARDFLSFQWDALLLEAGLLAIFIAPPVLLDRYRDRRSPPRVGVWLMVWLLFRLMLGSGLVKLASGDETWRSLTALTYHYETQPIPTPIAWYAARLPIWFQTVSAVATLAIELVVPLFVFATRRLRLVAFVCFVALQALIALTGNYAFFNMLSAALCVFLIDDHTIAALKRHNGALVERPFQGRLSNAVAIAAAVVLIPVSAYTFAGSLGIILPGGALVEPLAAAMAPLRSVNAYGLFAVMTTTRLEIVVEGSNDGRTWQPYEFKYKPGDPRRRPPWIAPFQPRLDWQMWFAALGRFEDSPWLGEFCIRLLDGAPDVLQLLEGDPFHGRPPKFLRAILYRYHFADARTHTASGGWWTRERLGPFSPVMSKP